jgi:hypothetical protein
LGGSTAGLSLWAIEKEDPAGQNTAVKARDEMKVSSDPPGAVIVPGMKRMTWEGRWDWDAVWIWQFLHHPVKENRQTAQFSSTSAGNNFAILSVSPPGLT